MRKLENELMFWDGIGLGLLGGLATNIFVVYLFRVKDAQVTNSLLKPQDLWGFWSGLTVILLIFVILVGLHIYVRYKQK